MKISALFLTVFTMLASSLVHSAVPETEENELNFEKGFIELRVGKKGNPFYGVIIDQDENPYLEIKPFMSTWFGIDTSCSIEAMQCQVQLPESRSLYWFSANSKEFGKGDIKSNWNDEYSVVKFDGSLWIKYSALEAWIPTTSTWSIRSYILSIIPQFKLTGVKLAEIESARKMEVKKKEEREKFMLSKPLVPKSDGFTEARAQYTSRYDMKNREFDNSFGYDLAADLFEGTMGAGGDLLSESSKEHIGYWFYENRALGYVDFAGIGDVRFDGSLIANNKLLKNGVKFDKEYRENGAGKFSKREFTEPNSIVDVYVNGFYQESVKADNLGFYEVNDLFVKGGDTVRFREVTPNGFENEKKYTVSGVGGGYLEKGQWDAQIVYGSEDDLNFAFSDIKYGIGEHFTSGLNFYLFEKLNNRGVIDSDIYVSNIMHWRFNSALSFGIELGINERSNAYRADWNINDRSYLSWESRQVDEKSVMRTSDWFEDYGYSYNRVRHNYVYGRTQYKTTILNKDRRNSYELEVSHKLQGRYSLNGTIGYEDVSNLPYSEVIVNKALDDGGTIEGGAKYQSEVASLFGYWRIIGKSSKPWGEEFYDRPWSANFGFNYDKDNGLSPTVSLDWQQADWISASISATTENVFLGFTVQFGASINKGKESGLERQSWHNFGSGTIGGRLMSPEENGLSEPVSDATVQVSNFKTVTDNNGYFFIDGVPADDEMEMFIDESSLDIRILPEKRKWKIKLRPGTKLDVNPKMVWSVGVDGFVENVPQGAHTITFKNQYSDEETSAAIESDGFYIIERLSPGKYTVMVESNNAVMSIFYYTIGSGDWFSDVNFNAKTK